MAFAIPRIQYKNVDTTGDTVITDDDIINIPDTSDIEVGMFVRGVGIPNGATVLSKTSSTVKMNSPNVASANGTGVALAFGYEILFVYPPKEESGEVLETKNTTSESLSGIQQVSVNYTEGIRKLKFSFLSPTLYATLDSFLRTWALLGQEFRYYDNQTLTTYVTVELDKLKVEPKKIAPRGVDTYVWEVPLNLRRVI